MAQATAIARHLRAGGRRQIVAGLIGEGAVETHPALRAYDRVVRIGTPADLARFNPVIPTGSDCTNWLIAHGVPIRVGDVEFDPRNVRCYDKAFLLDMAAGLDVPVPRTWRSLGDIPPGTGRIFYKPEMEGTGGPRDWAADVAGIPALARTGYLYQEYIASPGVHAVGFIARRGRIVEAYQHNEVASQPVPGGSAVAVRACDQPRLLDLTSRLVAGLDYHGWGLAEFKFCERRNDFVLMEINAKFWASIEFGLRTNNRLAGLLFGCRADGPPPAAMFWPNRAMRNGPAGLGQWLRWGRGTPRAREPLEMRAWLRGLVPVAAQDLLRRIRSA